MRVLPLLVLCLSACTGEPPSDGKTDGDDTSTEATNTAPTVSVISPTEGAQLRSGAALTLTASVADEETADDALELVWTSTVDGVLVGTSSVAGGVSSFTVPGGLSEGAATLIVTVTDEGGLYATDQVNVTVTENAAPTITITAPTSGSTYEEGDTVEVEVEGSDDADDPGDITLTWEGAAADYSTPSALDSAGSASFFMTDLPAGSLTVRVVATDSEGATASDEILLVVTGDADDDGYDTEADCDDTDPDVHPGAPEICDGLDQDCDDAIDEGATDTLTWYADSDGDGFGDPDDSTESCDPVSGYVDDDSDCDDREGAINPDADEVCDGDDNDCDGTVDESSATDATVWYADADTDGYGSLAAPYTSCTRPSGYVSSSTDCDDTDADVHPSATEFCNSADDDCDGTTDESDAYDASSWYADADGDGYGTSATTSVSCRQPSGYVSNYTDCDDGDRTVSPVGTETCDGDDEDCDGSVDEGATDASLYYVDADGDGYGTGTGTASCSAVTGRVTNDDDCDDTSATNSPAGSEVCDLADNDCDGTVDESTATDASTWYVDADGDGYGYASTTLRACTRPTGYVAITGDCDDTRATVYSGADEYCNSRDDDCDGTTDETTAVDVSTWYRDVDGDGYGISSTTTVSCTRPTGYASVSTDCDDAVYAVHPGATETCDSVDQDCDGTVDDSATGASTWYRDADSDGYGTSGTTSVSCTQPTGYVSTSTDCNDASASISPAATEVCDSTDNDCDGSTDESSASDASTWYRDADSDGYGHSTVTSVSCTRPTGYVSNSTDCNDSSALTYPGAAETCDSADNDCDGTTDESATDATTWYLDSDSDGYGVTTTTSTSCTRPTGYAAYSTDCDDTNAGVSPADTETCDGVDQDCDGTVDESASDATTWYVDSDHDGYGTTTSTTACSRPTGYVSVNGDCNDSSSVINPAATEVCDSADNDCDGSTDESSASDASTWYRDADSDGYGVTTTTSVSCSRPTGYVAYSTDCDDTRATVYPGASETCDSRDDDCDGTTDENDATDATTWYVDADSDGYGSSATTYVSCTAPSGYVASSTDCDDASSTINPAGTEICDGVDQDCDGSTDEGATTAATWYRDNDGDGYGTATSVTSCTRPTGYASTNGDCDDTSATSYPGATETCDSHDNDCDGTTDEDPPTWYRDADSDGYGNSAVTRTQCTQPTSYVANDDDCNDGAPTISPAATEVCSDSIDNDCDGLTDDSTSSNALTWYADTDGDGYGDISSTTPACTRPTGYVSNTTDCDDDDSGIHPSADERCDGIDNDCDGVTEEGFSVPGDYSTIAAAISAASSGDVICVAAGTYTGVVNFAGKNITIQGEGSDSTFIDVSGNRILMTNGDLIGVTIENGNQQTAAALQCSTAVGTPYLEDVVFEDNSCTNATSCSGVLYLSSCSMHMSDVSFVTNTVSSATGTVTGGLIYAYNSDFYADGLTFDTNTVSAGSTMSGGLMYFTGGSDPDIYDMVIDGNTITASSTTQTTGGMIYGSTTALYIDGADITSNTVTLTYGGYGGLFYFTGTSAPELDYLYIAQNTVRASSSSSSYPLYGGLMYFTTSADANMWWFDARANSVTGYYMYGGLVSGTYLSDPEFVQFIVAGNTVRSYSYIYGGLFDLRAYTGTSSSYSVGVMRFGDIAGNSVTASSAIYGGVLDGDYYYTSSSNISGTSYSTGWDLDMVNVVNNTMSGTTYGSVYYDDSSSYSPYTDWDYCNTYNNTGTDFYYFTDPSGGSGNVNYDPDYIDVSLASSIYWDLTLSSSSNVRNAGNPSSTYYDPDGTYAAIGAYGGPYADDW